MRASEAVDTADRPLITLARRNSTRVLRIADRVQAWSLAAGSVISGQNMSNTSVVAEMSQAVTVLDVDHAVADVVRGLDQEGQRMPAPHRVVVSRGTRPTVRRSVEGGTVVGRESLLLALTPSKRLPARHDPARYLVKAARVRSAGSRHDYPGSVVVSDDPKALRVALERKEISARLPRSIATPDAL